MFTKATRNDSFIKLALSGPSGSGKTYSALRLARGLVGPIGKIAVVDTENQSAKLYSDLTEFDHCDLASHRYTEFMEAVKAAVQGGYDVLVIDSLSHLWQSILDEKANIDRKGGNSYTNWSVPTGHLNETIQTILQAKIHVIVCMRSKQEYVLSEETNTKGKNVQVPRKVGTAPVMRDGVEYEFTTVLEIGMDHNATPSKDRTKLFTDKAFRIDESTGEQIAQWLQGGGQQMESNQEPDFLELIRHADSKASLKTIGQKIGASNLPESTKDVIRAVYKEKYNSVA